MSKKILTIQDISCYGQCSITVALPILSAYGVEATILPSAILSTHTAGFKNFTVLDLTDEMPKIINHWINEGIKFDAIYTGYIGDVRQFDYILECKDKLLKDDGLFIVDPAMADHGKLYPALSDDIVSGMIKISKVSDYIMPNITEACFLTGNEYKEEYDSKYIDKLIKDLYELTNSKIILSGVSYNEDEIGAVYYDGSKISEYYSDKQERSYHGTGDIFSSVLVANIVNGIDIKDNLRDAVEFIIDCIKYTILDDDHGYGVKFEDVLKNRK
ncbi:MAG: pyridoxamine kinase [Acholeplasmatales bacterium]|nr:pyridoxamine kinase [Acholeplasmatales bacterium]